MAETGLEACGVTRAYVRGQVLTCGLIAMFALIVLTVFDDPAAVPLALFARLCDVIPMVGIVIAVAPAAILALRHLEALVRCSA